jgi:uncharacterized OsmC-like protein
MSGLRDYLGDKRAAILSRREQLENGNGPDGPLLLSANVTAEGRSGVRRLRIRDHQILADTGPDFAGFDFGPTSPELQLGVLGTCLTHIFLIQAADREVPLDALSVEVTGQVDYRAGKEGFEVVPVYPHNLAYTITIDSPASDEELEELQEAVERVCPVLNLLRSPQDISGVIVRQRDVALAAD